MNDPTAGPGVKDTGEFIAISVANEAMKISDTEAHDRIVVLERAMLDIIERIHNSYHTAKGAPKRPWQDCRRTSCREAFEVLEGSKGSGNGQVQGSG